jgi:hypothetical protein
MLSCYLICDLIVLAVSLIQHRRPGKNSNPTSGERYTYQDARNQPGDLRVLLLLYLRLSGEGLSHLGDGTAEFRRWQSLLCA